MLAKHYPGRLLPVLQLPAELILNTPDLLPMVCEEFALQVCVFSNIGRDLDIFRGDCLGCIFYLQASR